MTTYYLITINNLALYNKLSLPDIDTHHSLYLVLLLLSGLFNFRVESSYYNFYNLHKLDKFAGLRLLRVRPHAACMYSLTLTEPN